MVVVADTSKLFPKFGEKVSSLLDQLNSAFKDQGLKWSVTETLRDRDRQSFLFASGRTVEGEILVEEDGIVELSPFQYGLGATLEVSGPPAPKKAKASTPPDAPTEAAAEEEVPVDLEALIASSIQKALDVASGYGVAVGRSGDKGIVVVWPKQRTDDYREAWSFVSGGTQ